MAKGAYAKEVVENKIKAAFGDDYVGTIDKKIYVWADDGGEKVQIAISMTCPKVPVGDTPVQSNVLDFTAMEAPAKMEVTEEEQNNLAELMARLGL